MYPGYEEYLRQIQIQESATFDGLFNQDNTAAIPAPPSPVAAQIAAQLLHRRLHRQIQPPAKLLPQMQLPPPLVP